MKNKIFIVLLPLSLLAMVVATGCSSSGATSEQIMALQNQINSLNNSLNSTQQQLNSTQQQLQTAQQALSQAQSQLQEQNKSVTSAQPRTTYQSTVIYRTYPYVYGGYSYGAPWYYHPTPPAPPAPPGPPGPPPGP